MKGYKPVMSFGEEVARTCRDFQRGDEVAAVAFLAARAGAGPALELAIGTGRIALPLAATGVPVAGVELSPHMAAQLKSRPGGDAIEVLVGDMASVTIARRFSLV